MGGPSVAESSHGQIRAVRTENADYNPSRAHDTSEAVQRNTSKGRAMRWSQVTWCREMDLKRGRAGLFGYGAVALGAMREWPKVVGQLAGQCADPAWRTPINFLDGRFSESEGLMKDGVPS